MNNKITQMYAFVILDDGLGHGNEGIPAIQLGAMACPMVGADMERVDDLRDTAKKLAAETGMKIELRKFTGYEVLEEF